LALIAIVPVLVRLPWIVRAPPCAGSLVIVPLLASVPVEITSVALLPALSPLVSVIEPAFVKPVAAVTSACAKTVLSIACPPSVVVARSGAGALPPTLTAG
jgi:hypothetical protein